MVGIALTKRVCRKVRGCKWPCEGVCDRAETTLKELGELVGLIILTAICLDCFGRSPGNLRAAIMPRTNLRFGGARQCSSPQQ